MAATNSEAGAPAILEARRLTLAIGGRLLLREVEFKLHQGELVLLLGVSGAGKTVFLKLLAGILSPGHSALHASGELHFEGENLLERHRGVGRIGILFQDHALFDELSPVDNLLFAMRHSRRRKIGESASEERRRSEALLEQLGVGSNGRVRVLSGGQQQRLALARTLALDPDLLLYDEPTARLDPANARRVAELIRTTHDLRPRASLIVTHDTRTLVPIADRIVLLDPAQQTLVEIPKEEAEQRLLSTAIPAVLPMADQRRRRGVRAFFEATADALSAVLSSLGSLLPFYPRVRYGLAYLGRALRIAASPGAFLYVGIAGVLLGFVCTYFTFLHMPKRGFTEPLFSDDVLEALGYLLYRVLAPVLVTVLIAARTGAAMASYIGNKVYSRQMDALRSFGVNPSRYLLTSLLWALLISMPFLMLVHYAAASLVSSMVYLYTHSDQTWFYWDVNTHRALRVPGERWYLGSGWLLAKIEICALGIALVAWFDGARDKQSADEVSRSVTETIILASLFVLLTHFVFAFLEF